MKLFFFLSLLILNFRSGKCQDTSIFNMEIGKSAIYDTVFVIDWISKEFKEKEFVELVATDLFFPFCFEGMNMQLEILSKKFTFFSISIEAACANYHGGEKYSLNLVLHIEDVDRLVSMVNQIGSPIYPISFNEIKNNSFDLITWRIDNVDIVLQRNIGVTINENIPPNKRNTLYNLSITNARPGELPGSYKFAFPPTGLLPDI